MYELARLKKFKKLKFEKIILAFSKFIKIKIKLNFKEVERNNLDKLDYKDIKVRLIARL